jgi:hypothetical protein
VTVHQFGHFKHGDRLPAIEDRFQLFVGIDLGLFIFVLQLIVADLFPEFFGEFGARQRLVAYHRCELFIRLHRFHECRVGLAPALFLFFSCRHNPFGLAKLKLRHDIPL